MSPIVKKIAIAGIVAILLVLGYIYFFQGSSDEASLISSDVNPAHVNTGGGNLSITDTEDFLSVLLNVKGIKLDDAIFSDPAFATLHDSTITLTPDGTEGRPNPFAPIGTDLSASTLPIVLDTNTATLPTDGVISAPVTTTPVTPTTPTTPAKKKI